MLRPIPLQIIPKKGPALALTLMLFHNPPSLLRLSSSWTLVIRAWKRGYGIHIYAGDDTLERTFTLPEDKRHRKLYLVNMVALISKLPLPMSVCIDLRTDSQILDSVNEMIDHHSISGSSNRYECTAKASATSCRDQRVADSSPGEWTTIAPGMHVPYP